jgi:nucleoid DNA-binding protein
MRSSNTKQIIKELAREHKFSEKEMETLIRTPFDFLTETMRNADRDKLEFPSVRIKYFATFYCSETRKRYFKRIKKLVEDAGRESISGTRAIITPVYPEGE